MNILQVLKGLKKGKIYRRKSWWPDLHIAYREKSDTINWCEQGKNGFDFCGVRGYLEIDKLLVADIRATDWIEVEGNIDPKWLD